MAGHSGDSKMLKAQPLLRMRMPLDPIRRGTACRAPTLVYSKVGAGLKPAPTNGPEAFVPQTCPALH
jgi:hypothetical protein